MLLPLQLEFHYHIDFELRILGDPAINLIGNCLTIWVLFGCVSFLRPRFVLENVISEARGLNYVYKSTEIMSEFSLDILYLKGNILFSPSMAIRKWVSYVSYNRVLNWFANSFGDFSDFWNTIDQVYNMALLNIDGGVYNNW